MDGEIKQLGRVFAVTLAVFFIQLAGAYYSNSLALFGDTGHVFSDLLAIGASLFAVWFATKAQTSRGTFGFHRAEVFAALFNGLLLVAMSLFIAFEAFQRLGGGYQINSPIMFLTTLIGLAGNAYVAYHLQHEENLNARSAFVHAAGDMLSSIGVLLGAVLIMATGRVIADVMASFLVSVIILISAYSILRTALSILLESAPYGASADDIAKAVLKVKGVKGVHDVHVWRTCSELILAMMHVETGNIKLADARAISLKIEESLRQEFNISHTTIQFEPFGCSCESHGLCKALKHKKRHTHH